MKILYLIFAVIWLCAGAFGFATNERTPVGIFTTVFCVVTAALLWAVIW